MCILLVFRFNIRDPSPQNVVWGSRMSSLFNVRQTFKNYFLLCSSTPSDYGLIIFYYLMLCHRQLKNTKRVTHGISLWRNFLTGLPWNATSIKILTIVQSATNSATWKLKHVTKRKTPIEEAGWPIICETWAAQKFVHAFWGKLPIEKAGRLVISEKKTTKEKTYTMLSATCLVA